MRQWTTKPMFWKEPPPPPHEHTHEEKRIEKTSQQEKRTAKESDKPLPNESP